MTHDVIPHKGGNALEAVKRFSKQVLCLPLFCLLALLLAPRARALTAAGNFGIEQVYVNVPEMDVFVRAQGANGAMLSPQMVRAAGVELRLGDAVLDTGNIQQANEAICYIFVLDNYADIEPDTLLNFQNAVVQVVRRKAARDQIMLYGMDESGGLQCLLPASNDGAAIINAVRAVKPVSPRPLDMAAAAAVVYTGLEEEYQNIAPRKVLYGMTDAVTLLGNLPMLAGVSVGMADQLNAAFYILAAADDGLEADLLAQIQSGFVFGCPTADIVDTLCAHMDTLTQVLEFKTAIDPDFYGERWETLTVAVPQMGSAVNASTTVYMGHRLTHPAVTEVRPTGRRELTVSFNQAVSDATAGLPAAYLIQSEDVWGFRVGVRSVSVADDGMSAVLTTAGPLYDGPYSVRLRKVAAALSAANTSDAGAETAFTVTGWPRDRGFYLARLRVPGIVLAVLLAVLAVGAFTRSRKERAAEKEAEIAHLLSDAPDIDTVPRRWLTLFLQPPGAIAESRWSGMAESSVLIGSDAGQCDLCVPDARMAPQHAVLSFEGDAVVLQPLGKARVYVNGQLLAGPHHLTGEDTVKLGRTLLRVV